MKIVYFRSKLEPPHEDGLLSAIRQAMPIVEVKTFTDCHKLSEWLKVPPRNFFAAILNPGNDRSLSRLIPLRRLLVDRKIIMVVPDDHKEAIALVHKFRPHYIQWMRDDCRALISILKNWLAAEQELDQQIETSTPPPH